MATRLAEEFAEDQEPELLALWTARDIRETTEAELKEEGQKHKAAATDANATLANVVDKISEKLNVAPQQSIDIVGVGIGDDDDTAWVAQRRITETAESLKVGEFSKRLDDTTEGDIRAVARFLTLKSNYRPTVGEIMVAAFKPNAEQDVRYDVSTFDSIDDVVSVSTTATRVDANAKLSSNAFNTVRKAADTYCRAKEAKAEFSQRSTATKQRLAVDVQAAEDRAAPVVREKLAPYPTAKTIPLRTRGKRWSVSLPERAHVGAPLDGNGDPVTSTSTSRRKTTPAPPANAVVTHDMIRHFVYQNLGDLAHQPADVASAKAWGAKALAALRGTTENSMLRIAEKKRESDAKRRAASDDDSSSSSRKRALIVRSLADPKPGPPVVEAEVFMD
jgi:hypothetical protein